jgi:UDP-glucose 4-epimerase
VLKAGAFDAVIHFAAFIEAGESMVDPGKYFHNTLALSLHLLDPWCGLPCRGCLPSTAALPVERFMLSPKSRRSGRPTFTGRRS